MATSKGLALVYGSKGTIQLFNQTGVLTVPPTPLTGVISTIESYDVTHEADVEQIKNSAGNVIAQIAANERISLNLTFIPSSSVDAATALTCASMPNVNGYATIAGADATTYGGITINGDYIYSGGGSVKFTSSGKAMVTITLTKYPAGGLAGTATVYTL
jgi:hypothetical protein